MTLIKDTNMLMDFPSLSSITIGSKNEPVYIKGHQSSFDSRVSSMTYNQDSYYDKPIIDEKIMITETTPKKKRRMKCSVMHQFKLFLSAGVVNITTHATQSKQKRHRFHTQCTRRLSHYGQIQRGQIGTGASANVLLTHQILEDGKRQVYAVKAFRKKKMHESEAAFMKKLISEFCISSALDHPNIVKTVDLVLDKKRRYCTVMEYCTGGDLYTFIKQGPLSQDDANGYFKQLLAGLSYLHRSGVAHRDIKPENLLLVKLGESTILKITDFGEADVFREAWQKSTRLSDGLCGSTPYIAPEIFLYSRQGYHASQADVWSAGIVYFCMRLNGVPFYSAQQSDANYRLYQKHYTESTYPAFDPFDQETRQMLYAMLNPDPEKRYTIQDVLKLTWLAEVEPPNYYN